MERFYSHDKQCEVQQIQKRTARKLFNSGATIYLQPCNLTFDNFWSKPMAVDRKSIGLRTFDGVCREFEFYNCDNERGQYPRFYVKC